jgi:hypothetical protein
MPSGRSLKKTDAAPKKTRQRLSLEEDGAGRKCIFTPAETRQIRVGGHNDHIAIDEGSAALRSCLRQTALRFGNEQLVVGDIRECGDSEPGSEVAAEVSGVTGRSRRATANNASEFTQPLRLPPERVNDFAAHGGINLVCGVG